MPNSEEAQLQAARAGDDQAFEGLVAPYRRGLRAHCYRMSGSVHDAEDLLQDSLLRAWRGLGGFEGRSSVKTWLYRVATSACLDALDWKKARTMPDWLGAASRPNAPVGLVDDVPWLEPFPDDAVEPAPPDARLSAKESVALAFLTALQLLPPKQRAVLILRDVLGWQANECTDLLDMSLAAVNSALQRARETLETKAHDLEAEPVVSDSMAKVLEGYVRAWEQADVPALVALLRHDAVLTMPPYAAWFQGPADIGAALGAMVLTPAAKGQTRFLPTRANGLPGLAAYVRGSDGRFEAAAIQLLSISAERITGITAFVTPRVFPLLGLPGEWPGEAR